MKRVFLARDDYRRIMADLVENEFYIGLRKSKASSKKMETCCNSMKLYMKKRERWIVYHTGLRKYFLPYYLFMSSREKGLIINGAKKSQGSDPYVRAQILEYCPWCGSKI
jgi:hypothetical protein